jgi:hypothetical protein
MRRAAFIVSRQVPASRRCSVTTTSDRERTSTVTVREMAPQPAHYRCAGPCERERRVDLGCRRLELAADHLARRQESRGHRPGKCHGEQQRQRDRERAQRPRALVLLEIT